MELLQSFVFELMPDGEQACDMGKFAGSCRFVFNKALAIQIENHEAGHKFITYESMAKQLTAWRNSSETPWLKKAPCHSLQHALKDLDRAYKNFFSNSTISLYLRKRLINAITILSVNSLCANSFAR